MLQQSTRSLVAIAALVCLTPLASSQTDFAPRGYDTRSPLPSLTAEDTQATAGAGFSPRSRFMFRTAAANWDPGGPDSPTLNATLAYLASPDLELAEVNLIHQQLDRFSGSIELMGQHLWSWSNGVQDPTPALRLGIQNAAFAMDVGRVPMADRGVLAVGPPTYPRQQPWRVVQYVAYGLRADSRDSDLRFAGLTDIAGRISSHTDRDELLIGPQLAFGAVAQRGGWLWDASLLAVAGYRNTNTTQTSRFGDDAVPGGLNNLYFLQPTYTRYGERRHTAAWLGEARLIGSYYFSPHLTLDLMASAVLAPESTEASQVVQYTTPDFGIGGEQDEVVLNGNVYLGLTYLR